MFDVRLPSEHAPPLCPSGYDICQGPAIDPKLSLRVYPGRWEGESGKQWGSSSRHYHGEGGWDRDRKIHSISSECGRSPKLCSHEPFTCEPRICTDHGS